MIDTGRLGHYRGLGQLLGVSTGVRIKSGFQNRGAVCQTHGMSKPLVTDELWAIVEPLLPPEPPTPTGGHPRVPYRAALTGIMFVLRSGGLPLARTVAFASIIATQLAQTLDVGRAEGGLSRSVLGAVTGSAGLLAATIAVRPLRDFLMLVMPGPLGLALVGAAALIALLMSRGLAFLNNWPHWRVASHSIG